MRWAKNSTAIGKADEYMVTERSPTEFPLYVRPIGEVTYRPLGTFRSLAEARGIAEIHNSNHADAA